MKITFLMPGYMWGPSGGFKVVYEYANRLVSRGHEVAVVHPRRRNSFGSASPTLRDYLRRMRFGLMELVSTPSIDWHSIDRRVNLLFVASSHARHVPDADIIFATAWNTAREVMRYSPSKGEKCYLIQHYETWMGPKDQVDETWRMPLHKIVVSQWLADVGTSLTNHPFTHIPNGVDLQHYRIIRPIESRTRQVVMMCSPVAFKAAKDGIAALQTAKTEFPDLRVILFGNSRRPSWVPQWMVYEQDPPQNRIVEDFYNGSSIVVSSSLAEGFALPPAEGAACGCAIAATDSGGIREFARHGDTALLSPPKDPQALANNICLLLGNDALRIRLAHSAHTFIQQFTWQRSTDLLEEFVAQAVQRKPSSQLFPPSIEVSPA
jgi:glycosyltransferase involved in cell wall biosynthesis